MPWLIPVSNIGKRLTHVSQNNGVARVLCCGEKNTEDCGGIKTTVSAYFRHPAFKLMSASGDGQH